MKTAALVCCAMVLIRHAWVCDDAFITLRTVRNFLDGDGLRWNLHERVQSFTHPLWMLVLSLSFAVVREPVSASLIPSLGLSVAMLYLIAFRLRLSAPAALLALACVISSKSFVDYSTSGLENPLTHFLFVVLLAEHLRSVGPDGGLRTPSRQSLARLTLWTALIGLNRLDAVLIALPLLFSAYSRVGYPPRALGSALVRGFAPLLLWEVFSITYYGFPFPNTAYAKLASGVPSSDLWLQGVLYYLSQLAFDPVSLLAMACALVFVLRRRERALYSVVLGLFLYLLYIVSIGGDFMAGRYFSLPVLLVAVMLAHGVSNLLDETRSASYLPALATLAAGIIMSPHPPVSMNSDYELGKNAVSKELWDERGVCDERAFYSVSVALLRANRHTSLPNNWHMGRGLGVGATAVESMAQIGVAGFFAPRTAIIIDSYGLADPFVARMPATKKVDWRPGHYAREMPPGFVESLREGRNLIIKRHDARLYERVRLVVSGPIWSWERWKEIARLNLGMPSPDTVLWEKRAKKRDYPKTPNSAHR